MGATEDPKADAYEAAYMQGERAILRSKKPMGWWWHALMGFVGLATVAAAVGDSAPVALVALPLVGFTWILFSYLRVVVTSKEVHVQLGVFGPKIPIDRIDACTVEEYKPLRYGGWGIRRGLDGSWAYSIPGGTHRGVRIEYRSGSGKKKAVFVSSNDAEEVAAAIARARAVRVEDSPSPVEVDVEAKRETDEKAAR